MQAKGRGRAEDSSYTLVEVKNTGVAEKESVNEYRQKMMDKAIDKIRAMNQVNYDKRVWLYLLHQKSCIVAVRILPVMFVLFLLFHRSQTFRYRL